MPRPRLTIHRRTWIAAGAILLAAALLAASLPHRARAQTASGYGAGVFAVNGTASATFFLADGGTYSVVVATDDVSSYVDARISFNGSLAAELNESGSAATRVSLAPGNYSLALSGHGRAALGWDFPNGSVQGFPDNESATGFLRPASAHVDVFVSMGDAQEIHLEVYDDRLLPVTETNVTASGTVSADLPAARATAAFLLAWVVTGNPHGLFGLAWSSPPPPGRVSDPGALVLLALLWIGVPIVLAVIAFLLLRRRGRRFP